MRIVLTGITLTSFLLWGPLTAQIFDWAHQFGGKSLDEGFSVAVDATGDVYLTGTFEDTAGFDPGPGTNTLISSGDMDVFIQKLDAQGNSLWVKQFGSKSDDISNALSLDDQGNIYVAGFFQDTAEYEPGAGNSALISSGSRDAFLLKIDGNGNLLWSAQFGGTGGENAYSVALDANGAVYTTGFFAGTVDFDPSANLSNLTSAGGLDVFILKLDSLGNYIWAKQLGGTSADFGMASAIDASGNIYTTGYFQGTADFDPGSNTSSLSSAGSRDVFVQKMDANGGFLWAAQIGGPSIDQALSLALNDSGEVHITGYFQDTADFDPGPGIMQLTSAGNSDIFVLKLDTSGNLIWAHQTGGSSNDVGNGIVADALGNVYVTGSFQDTVDFDPEAGSYNMISAGFTDIFIQKLNNAGNFLWAQSMGGKLYDGGHSIALGYNGGIYTTGFFEDTADFDPGMGASNLISRGATDVFVQKMTDASFGTTTARLEDKLKLYPNPAGDRVSIDLGVSHSEVHIAVTDYSGKILNSKTFRYQQIIDLKLHQPPGLYFLVVRYETKQTVLPLVKK